MDNKIAGFSEQFGRRIKNTVEDSEKNSASFPTDNKARLLAGHTSPVEITGAWTLEGGTWKCRAQRLWRIDGVYQMPDNSVEFDLYHPTITEQPSQGIGERVFAVFRGVWELVSGAAVGSAAPSAEITVPVLYPARQWTPKLPIDGTENKSLWSDSDDPLQTFGTWFMHACGLTNEGKTPLPVMEFVTEGEGVRRKEDEAGNVLYYRNIKLDVAEKFAQSDGETAAAWKLLFVDSDTEVPALTADTGHTTGFVSAYRWLSYLATLDGKTTSLASVDYSDQWETTTNPEKALKRGHQMIAPHSVVGYSLGTTCTYNPSENKTVRHEDDSFVSLSTPVIVPIVKKELTNQLIFAEVELDLYEITEGEVETANGRQQTAVVKRKLETVEDLVDVDRECIYAYLPEYQNDKPLVKDTVSIENNCTGTPLLGLWKDGIFPQLLFCENIPYGYCIPLKTIQTLIKTTCDDCSPVYNSRKYTVALDEFEGNKILVPLNIDYKPSIRCQS